MSAQQTLKHLTNHTLFRILHYSLIGLQLRDELTRSPGNLKNRRIHEWQPFALWLANLLLTYAGDILGNLLLGSLPLEPLCNAPDVLLCSVIWYLVFYSPFDLFYKLTSTATVRVLGTTMVAISQVVLIDRGVQVAGQMYNNAMLPMLVVGTVMGSGAEFLKPVASLLINKCQQNNNANIKLTTTSKLALMISGAFALQIKNNGILMDLSRSQLVFYLLVALITFKYMSLMYSTEHAIWLLESRMHYTFFGGLTVDLAKFFMWQTPPQYRQRKSDKEFE